MGLVKLESDWKIAPFLVILALRLVIDPRNLAQSGRNFTFAHDSMQVNEFGS